MKKIISCIGRDIIWAVLVLTVGTAALYISGFRFYIVQSGSMEPDIPTGSVIIVSTSADISSVEKGDVVCFTSPNGQNVTHRAVSVTEEGIETKGDANRVSDGITVTGDNFVGTEVLCIPFAGYILALLRTPGAVIIMITVILAAAILSFIRKGWNEKIDTQNRQGSV